ncbi:hypothetical protein [Jannaschia sp. CCS1]|uniref:hypothetical protein n=1 Tax=Jannaschia sp. (strain CCS1) TaxID=290400 RepID=UPI000053CCEC|nr:hypothetical protein [Jannaschia sp. CCS1]ABD54752.1 hypothetical protein Jann_1835 [Jannaschia sp. CCS1]
MAHAQSTEVFFIVDGLRLEAQACLLAPSLKRHLMPHQRAVAYLREDYLPKLDEFTVDVLAASDVETRVIADTNGGHAPWLSPYPHGNKILAAAMPRDCEISVFLDTDTILTEPVDFAQELGGALIAACVSDYASSAGTQEDWEAFYAAYSLPLPKDRVQLNGGRRLWSLPYFNAGVIVFRERTIDGIPLEVGRDWLHTAMHFEREVTRDYGRSNIDQFTLPILGYLRKMPVKSMGQHMNFNIQAFGDGEGQPQSVAHYHRIGALWKHKVHGREALDTLAEIAGRRAPETFLEVFGLEARRKNMKHHLRAMAEEALSEAA